MTRSLSVLAGAVLLASLAACSSEPAVTPTPEITPTPEATPTVAPTMVVAPFHAIPADAVAVDGAATCAFSEDAEGFMVACDLAMSDPRVSGTERHQRFRFYAEGPGGRVWVAESAVITNAAGTWHGSAQAAESVAGIPSGEAHYFGEGAYAGLVFHYYFFHPDLSGPAQLRGWISGGGNLSG